MKKVFTFLSVLVVPFMLLTQCKSSDQDTIDNINNNNNPSENSVVISIEDAVIKKNQADNNYSDSKDLIAYAWTCNAGADTCLFRSLIKFDLSALQSNLNITSAYLAFSANEGSDLSAHFGFNAGYLNPLTESWDVNSVNWNNQPAFTTTGKIEIDGIDVANLDYVEVDITDLVIKYISDPSSNKGFLLRLQSEVMFKSLNFASSNHSDTSLRPKLIVNYE